MKNKNNKWCHERHLRTKKFLYFLLKGITKRKYGYTWTDFKGKENQNYLILFNHVCDFDQFFVGYPFKNHAIYYVASEDIFSMPFFSKMLKHLVAPIPFKKSTNDTRAVMNCMKVAKEGGFIAMAPEGNRTYSGTLETVKISISKFVKALKLPVAFFNISGAYGVKPRWADKVRKGKCHGEVKSILEYAEYKDMSNEELYAEITKRLYQDDTKIEGTYQSKHKAEYLERAIYVCPHCGLSEFKTKGDNISCLKCGLEVKYTEKLNFEKVKGDFNFKNVKEWYDYQNNYINNLDLNLYNDKVIYQNVVKVFKVILYKKKEKISSKCMLELYNDKYVFTDKSKVREIKFDDISVASVLGRNKFNFYYGEDVYQIKADKSFNALKYVNIYYHYKNIKENNHEQFLGL